MKNGRKPSNLVKSHFIRLYIGSPSTTLPSSEHHWHDFVIHYYVWNKIHKSHMTIFWAGSIQMIPFLMQTFFFSYKVICVISASRFLKRSLMNGIYQNCSDVLWEKIVLVIEKTFWNSRLKAENFQIFEMTKGQLISKANCQAEDSSKKQTNEFVFTSMWRVFVRFLEESSARKKRFEIFRPLEHKKSA